MLWISSKNSTVIVFTIKYFRRPCSIERVNHKTPVEALYSNKKLSIDQKKNIANKTTELAEKHKNTSHVCKIFTTYAEAQHYQIKYQSHLFVKTTIWFRCEMRRCFSG